MAPWMQTTLAELEAAHAIAEERLKEADKAYTEAQLYLEAAKENRNDLCHLLRDFRDYARSRSEGGAP